MSDTQKYFGVKVREDLLDRLGTDANPKNFAAALEALLDEARPAVTPTPSKANAKAATRENFNTAQSEWDTNPTLREEYAGNFAAFAAFHKAQVEGRTHIGKQPRSQTSFTREDFSAQELKGNV